jgi:hypothetical protein
MKYLCRLITLLSLLLPVCTHAIGGTLSPEGDVARDRIPFSERVDTAANHRTGIATDLLRDIIAPSIRLDMYLGERYVLSLTGSYGWWDFEWERKRALRLWDAGVAANYYLTGDGSFTGHRIGLGVRSGQFDAKKNEYGYRGHFTGVGVLYGHTWRLGGNDRWYLDAGLGLGYRYRFEHKYQYNEFPGTYCCQSHRATHRPALTEATVSFIYRFNTGRR